MNDAAGWTGNVDSTTGAEAAINGSMPTLFVLARDEDVFIRFGGATLTAADVDNTSTAHDRLAPAGIAMLFEIPSGASVWAALSRTGTAVLTMQPCQEV